ncbi:hypothetical protein BsWGS_02262 [Bradybaena similaris]
MKVPRPAQEIMGCLHTSRLTQRKRILLRVISDVICILLVAAGIFGIKFGSNPYKRGFFCDDESIKHPFLEDTISVTLAACIGMFLPLVVIIILEFLLRKKGRGYVVSTNKTFGKSASWIYSIYNTIIVFVFGMAVTQFLTEVGKYSIGRLRPHFLTLCNPDWTKVNCSAGYITDDVCTSTDTEMMTEARLSFPSGHSSFSMYCMLYLILYLEARLSCQAVTLVRPLSQLFCFCLGFFTCLSRISDYKHHWSDVLSGSVLGMVVCILVVLSVSDFGHVLRIRASICKADNGVLAASVNHTVEEEPDTHYNGRPLQDSQPSRQTSNLSHIVKIEQLDL